ncbi:MAG: hypothetical protein GY809_27080, partial [Planctomycetes bacterium]|nr:hypothetical protein [Planctomycetota bacterium]
MKKALVLVVLCFVGVCAWMIFDALDQSPALDSHIKPLTLLQQTTTTTPPATEPTVPAVVPPPALEAGTPVVRLNALGGEIQSVQLGSTDKDSGYKYLLDLTSTGAALNTASFSEWDNRARTDPEPQTLLQPTTAGNGRQVRSLASQALLLYNYDQKLSLDQLAWKLTQFSAEPDSTQTAQFEATIVTGDNQPALRVLKTYTVQPNTYLFDVKIEVSNLTPDTQKLAMNLGGPVGLEQEGFRQDMRNTVALYKKADGEFSRVAPKNLRKADLESRRLMP